MRDFGDYVVIIADEKEFLRRVHAAASREEFEYLCGNVHYRRSKRKGETVELGNRHHAVVKAREAYTLDLGCRLDDIVYVAEAEKLNQELEKLFLSKTISLGGRYIWYGNIDKHALRDKFYGLGDNKASLLGVIG